MSAIGAVSTHGPIVAHPAQAEARAAWGRGGGGRISARAGRALAPAQQELAIGGGRERIERLGAAVRAGGGVYG